MKALVQPSLAALKAQTQVLRLQISGTTPIERVSAVGTSNGIIS
jgi:hypothetical protein